MKTKEKHNPFKGRFLIFSVLIFLFLLPIAVEASTIYLNSMYGEIITISYNGRTIHTLAGEFNTTLNDQDYNLEDFYSPAYCIDLNNTISIPGFYDMELQAPYMEAAWLMNEFSPGLGYSEFGYTSRKIAAGLQASIWETVYGDAFQLKSGGVVATLSAKFLDALSLNYNPADLDYKFFNADLYRNGNNDYQDLMVSAAPVPEPATLLLLGSGLIGLVGIGRKKAKIQDLKCV